ncbi:MULTISPECIES: hypothetical protein [unclassified Stenotrophomonas]|uniref:hypothetical protein n=1 Tax=unclassified Stenotrophomonas TaxID=196198 RepID=UPI001C62A542|nr:MULTISPECIES: hypothetical protein [unclassified Stenotrophomonas]
MSSLVSVVDWDMRNIDGQEFKMVFDQGGSVFEAVRIANSSFDNCGMSLSKHPSRMSSVRDVVVSNCKVINSEIGPTVFEDVQVEGLDVNPVLLLWSCFYRRVCLVGKIGKIRVNIEPSAFCTDAGVLAEFAERRAAFYSSVDWALDISRARFVDFACKGVPLALIRRDPETQVIVRKQDFSGVDMLGTQFASAFPETHTRLGIFGESIAEEALLVVPLAAPRKRREDWAGGIAELRRLGIVSS